MLIPVASLRLALGSSLGEQLGLFNGSVTYETMVIERV